MMAKARMVLWLNAACLLLMPLVGVAHAGALYVDCDLKEDWASYKAGDHQRFVLREINRAIYDDYQEHCDFNISVFSFTIDGEIDHAVEDVMVSLKNVLESDTIFKKYVESPSLGVWIYLNSDGGDINTALRVGKMIRDLQARVEVGYFSKCISSCIFLLAGGVNRGVYGAIGVHRPYFPALSTKLAPSEISHAYEQQRTLIAKYLNDMNVPSSLLDFMYETPPESVHYLNQSELAKYRLNSADPIFDERITARMADLRGITSAEYRQRIVEEDSICGPLEACFSGTAEQIRQCGDQRLTCTQAVSWGLSMPDYLKRNKEAERCPSLRDSASVDAFAACIKAAMLGK